MVLRAEVELSAGVYGCRRFVEAAHIPPRHYVALRPPRTEEEEEEDEEIAHGGGGGGGGGSGPAGGVDPTGELRRQAMELGADHPLDPAHGLLLVRAEECIKLLRQVARAEVGGQQGGQEQQRGHLCYRVSDELPDDGELAGGQEAQRRRVPATEWGARRPLPEPPDEEAAAAFAEALRFTAARAAATVDPAHHAQERAPDDPHDRAILEDGGLSVCFLEGAGDAVAFCGTPFPPKGRHSVRLCVDAATHGMAIGVVGALEQLPRKSDHKGWVGAAASGLCLHNGSGGLRRGGKQVVATPHRLVKDGSVVTLTHHAGQLTFDVDGVEYAVRGAKPPLHLCVCDQHGGGVEVRLLAPGESAELGGGAHSEDDEEGDLFSDDDGGGGGDDDDYGYSSSGGSGGSGGGGGGSDSAGGYFSGGGSGSDFSGDEGFAGAEADGTARMDYLVAGVMAQAGAEGGTGNRDLDGTDDIDGDIDAAGGDGGGGGGSAQQQQQQQQQQDNEVAAADSEQGDI